MKLIFFALFTISVGLNQRGTFYRKDINTQGSETGFKDIVDSIYYHSIFQDGFLYYYPYHPIEVATRFTPSQYPVRVDSVSLIIFISNAFPQVPDTIRIYSDNYGVPGTLLTEVTYTKTISGTDAYEVIITLSSPPEIDTGDFWISYTSCVYGADSLFVVSDTTTNADPTRNRYFDGSTWQGFDKDWGILAFVTYIETGTPDIIATPNPLYIDLTSKEVQCSQFSYDIILPKIEPELMTEIKTAKESLIPVTISLKKKLNYRYLKEKFSIFPPLRRRHEVAKILKEFAQEEQKSLLRYLKDLEIQGKVRNIKTFWINNSVSCEIAPEELEKIADREDVGYIFKNKKLTLFGTKDLNSQIIEFESAEKDKAIVWNILAINADSVWSLGYTGSGVLVAHLDTGVNYNHYDLQDHMWDGGRAYPNHGYDFGNNDNDPMDVNGHGTHTAGTIAGDGTAGTRTGVAPDAIIMALKIFDDAGNGDNTMMGQAVQFALDHDADLLSMSAGFPNPNDYIKDWSRQTAGNLYAAGIPWIVAAGNGDLYDSEGDGDYHYTLPQDIYSPADVPPPWNPRDGNGNYGGGENAVIAVGALNQDSSRASFSSYGPTEWNTTNYSDYPYPPGLMKPDIAAPGGIPGITSLDYSTNNGYVSGWTGTSMACPHVAGVVALMLQKNPDLPIAMIDSILETTAYDLGTSGKDNYYGSGMLDALAAVNATPQHSNFVTGSFYVINNGTATLSVNNIEKHRVWIVNVSPKTFSLAPGDTQIVSVTVDTTLINSIYEDTLLIYSNDPDENPYSERVILVTSPIFEEQRDTGNSTDIKIVAKIVHLNGREITFTLPESGFTTLELFNVEGRRIKIIVHEFMNAGQRKVTIPGNLKSGVYFLRIKQKSFSEISRIIIL